MPKRPGRHRNSAVVAAWIRPEQVAGAFMDAQLAVRDYDEEHQGYLRRSKGGGSISMQTSPRVAEARSQIVDNYLTAFPDSDWLWWTDADAGFDEDILERLMDVASYPERPIVGALAFAGSRKATMYPTLYGRRDHDDGVEITRPFVDYPRNALVKVAGTGCHCVLVHRQVFRALAAAFAKLENGKPNPYPWYAEGHVDRNGRPIGEDIIFCMRAASLDIPTYVHTGIKTDHLKLNSLNEALWEERMAADPLPPMEAVADVLPDLKVG